MDFRLIRVGVCARDKKVKSKPMQEIMGRFPRTVFDLIVFGDDMILNQPIEAWPRVDCLISFYSTGFPLEKAQSYVRLRKPQMVNDLSREQDLRDRRKFYEILQKNDVPVPNHVIVSRDTPGAADTFKEYEDAIEINGKKIQKPFVEKPIDADDHNIYIYYPRRMGGGSKRLFRKVRNTSSRFYPDENDVRKEGSYIYEEFLMTQGTDIKIYMVGPHYAHAEARKSPVVDGIVQRDAEGKEVRYPIMLTAREKDMARKVFNAFQQTVCGFDLLRTAEVSYVCDVNGWSFVKKSHKYYDDTANILCDMMYRTLVHTKRIRPPPLMPARTASRISAESFESRQRIESPRTDGGSEELRCVVAIIRHGDRTPKQKMKMVIRNERFVKMLQKYQNKKKPEAEVKLKRAVQLQEVLDATRAIIEEADEWGSVAAGDSPRCADTERESLEKLRQMKDVLEKGGKFSGINRKVQIKPQSWRVLPALQPAVSNEEEDITSPEAKPATPDAKPSPYVPAPDTAAAADSTTACPPLGEITDLDELAALREAGHTIVPTEALLVLKWGGVLTDAGRESSEMFGRWFRSAMYPGEGTGLLRLHSTYRHDLKIYSSDEGRVQMTAASFVKGLLDLEGELTPILASLVRAANTEEMLDDTSKARQAMDVIKKKLKAALIRTYTYVEEGDGDTIDERTTIRGDVEADDMTIRSGADNFWPGASTVATPTVGYDRDEEDDGGCADEEVEDEDGEMEEGGVDTGGLVDESAEEPSTIDKEAWQRMLDTLAPTMTISFIESLNLIGPDPVSRLYELKALLHGLTRQVNELLKHQEKRGGDLATDPVKLYAGETLWLMHERWRKLEKDFFHARKQKFDLSKIPDIYDNIKYDALHNSHLGLTNVGPLHTLARALADIVIPQEYGITADEKRDVAAHICHHLMRKIFFDLTAVKTVDAAPLAAEPALMPGGGLASPVQSEAAGGPGSVSDQSSVVGGSSIGGGVPVYQQEVSASPGVSEVGGGSPALIAPADGRISAAPRPGTVDVTKVPRGLRHFPGSFEPVSFVPPGDTPVTAGADPCRADQLTSVGSAVANSDASGPKSTTQTPIGRDISMPRHPNAAFSNVHIGAGHPHAMSAPGSTETSPWNRGRPGLDSSINSMSSLRIDDLSNAGESPQASGDPEDLAIMDSGTAETTSYSTNVGLSPECVLTSSLHPSSAPEIVARSPSKARLNSVDSVELEEPAIPASVTVSSTPAGNGTPARRLSATISAVRSAPSPHHATTAAVATPAGGDTDSAAGSISRIGSNASVNSLAGGGNGVTLIANHNGLDRHQKRRDSVCSKDSALTRGDDASTVTGRRSRKGGRRTAQEASSPSRTRSSKFDGTDSYKSMRETVQALDPAAISTGGYAYINTPSRHVRTRLYFTSESHVHSITNVLKYWGDKHDIQVFSADTRRTISKTPELDYLTHVVFRLFENMKLPDNDPKRHRIEIMFSPGCSFNPFDGSPYTPEYAAIKEPRVPATSHVRQRAQARSQHPEVPPGTAPPLLPPAQPLVLAENLTLEQVEDFFGSAITVAGRHPYDDTTTDADGGADGESVGSSTPMVSMENAV